MSVQRGYTAFLTPKEIEEIALDFPKLLQTYHFNFFNLEEATQLAHTIASFYPDNHKIIECGLMELFINAIEHGNLGIDSAEKKRLKEQNKWEEEIHKRLLLPQNRHKNVEVGVEITPSYICTTVKDQGTGNQNKTNEYDLYQPSGRGLLIASGLSFDAIEFSPKGNVVACYTYIGIPF